MSKAGIGVTFSKHKVTGEYVVKKVIDGGVAWKTGLVKKGDVFYKVDGIEVSDLDPEVLCSLIQGENGSSIVIQMIRGCRMIKISMHRGPIDAEYAEQANALNQKITDYRVRKTTQSMNLSKAFLSLTSSVNDPVAFAEYKSARLDFAKVHGFEGVADSPHYFDRFSLP